MNNLEKLSKSVKFIAIGYIFIYFNFTLNNIDLLPSFAGYLFMLSALPEITKEEDSASLLRPLAIILAVWNGFVWVLSIFTRLNIFPSLISGLSLFASVIAIYFHFQLLTYLARIAEKYGCPEAEKLLKLRTVTTVITAVLTLPLHWFGIKFIMICAAIINFVILILITVLLFKLRNSLLNAEPIEFISEEKSDNNTTEE